MKSYEDFKELNNNLITLLENYRLNTIRYGLVLILENEEFDNLAEDHPYLVHPEMILFSRTDNQGKQYLVQITKGHIPESQSYGNNSDINT